MDFTNHGAQSHPVNAPPRPAVDTFEDAPQKGAKHSSRVPSKGWRATFIVLLFSVVVLLIAMALLFAFGSNGEGHYLNSKALQAVDINIAGTSPTNQVYFGHIKNINSSFFVMQDVYFFQASSSSTTASTTLEPLVCQIDSPFDQMIINRSSVVWWENLQSTGQVAKTITQYEKDHPSGSSCPTSSSTSSSSSTTKQ